ncbi:hypothetical protein ACJW30_06G205500 [Castanea mollissima]
MWVFVVCLTALFVKLSHWIYTQANPRCNGKLPPGSMGYPIIGETIEFFSPYSLHDIPPFVRKRMTRYGSLFRTNLVGRNVVVSTDPEVNHFIFQQEGTSFLISYTQSFNEIFGQQSLISYHGMVHKYLRNLILQLVGPENLKGKSMYEINEATRRHLHSWARHGTVDIKEVTSEMIFEYFAKKLMSYDESKASRKLRENYKAFMDGLISFPLNIPGTAYHACLQVINETVRLANIVPGIFRKALKDVEVKGYTIPAGWTVMVVPSVLHLSPTEYDDPLAFNPWRWKGKDLHAGSKTFMAFGGGVRLCVGADVAKLLMASFLHYLITKYRWTVTKGGDIIRKPGLVFPNGLHIKISEK